MEIIGIIYIVALLFAMKDGCYDDKNEGLKQYDASL